MNVGDSVRHGLDHWDNNEWDAAMLHACNAVDGTGKKRYPKLGVGARFKQTTRRLGHFSSGGCDWSRS
jgi:hypothetical protein